MNNFYDLKNMRDKHNFAVHLTNLNHSVDAFPKIVFDKSTKVLNHNLDIVDKPIEKYEEIVNDRKKALAIVADSYFHYFSDFVGIVIVFLENCIKNNIKDIDLIFVSNHKPEIVGEFNSFLEYCINSFKDRINITYQTIILDDHRHIKINNYTKIQQKDIGESINQIYENAIKFAECNVDARPDKKVFLSRSRDIHKDTYPDRSKNEADVEKFFESIGFEIVNGEMFGSLKKQINFFNSVSVFAGFTGSGLTSSMFMQNNQTVIEVICPIKFNKNLPEYELHNFYKTISVLKNHNYIGIANINKSSTALIQDLTKISKML